MGHGAGPFLQGSDCFYEHLPHLRQAAVELLEENRLVGEDLDPSLSEYTIYGKDELRGLRDTGFTSPFQDGSSQPRHFWFAVQVEMMYPSALVNYQAYGHENPEHWLGSSGGSQEDTMLSLLGSQLGQGLDDGTIKPSGVGEWIRTHLAEDQVLEYRLVE